MPAYGRLTQDGSYLTSGRVNTRKPLVTNSLVFSMPFDQAKDKSFNTLANCRVLGYYQNASHPTYDYIAPRCEEIVLSPNILTEDVATVAATYDLVIVDNYVWSISSTIMLKLKEFVDVGVSVIAIGNDTRTNIFVSSYTAVAHVSHTVTSDPYGRLDDKLTTYASGSADVFGGINSLQNGAIPEYYRDDTNQIMGYTYTSESGAVLFFDQQGFGNRPWIFAGIEVCIQSTRGRQQISAQSPIEHFSGLGVHESTENLYTDGDYALKTLHPVRNGPWTFPANIKGPNGQQVIRVDADGTTNYHGKDIEVTVGLRYTASVWCYVSPDNDSTLVELQGEQAFSYTQPTCQYDLTKKGTWQFLYMTGDATTTNARILAYDIGAATRGFALFSDIQFQQEKYPTPYVNGAVPACSFYQKFSPQSECTIIGKFKPLSSFDNSPSASADYTNTSNNQSSLIGVHDTVNGSNAYYKFYQNTTTGNSSPFLDPDGTWGTSHRHVTYELTTDELYYVIKLTSNTTLSINIYQNGEWKGEHIHTFTETTSAIDAISFGSYNSQVVWNGYHSNVSIYGSIISDAEIERYISKSYKVTTRETIAKNLVSSPYLGNEVSYLSLGANGGDNIQNTIVPVVDSSNYSQGAAYVGGVNGKLQYNLNSTLGLNWNGDWSICYMKKPIGTHTGEASLTGYSIESLGSNSNSVGGGYIWWGKNNGSNALSSTTNSPFTSTDFFNNWQYVTLVKSGTTLTIETWLIDRVTRTRTATYTNIASNYFVNQYGYDLYLGGWDNNSGCYTYFKNLLIAQRALNPQELNNFRLNKLKALKDVIHIQAGVETNVTL